MQVMLILRRQQSDLDWYVNACNYEPHHHSVMIKKMLIINQEQTLAVVGLYEKEREREKGC